MLRCAPIASLLLIVTVSLSAPARGQDVSAGAQLVVSSRASDGFLNIRRDPDPEAPIIRKLGVGETAEATGKHVKRGSMVWYQVWAGNRTGWVNAYYIERRAPPPRSPEAAAYRSDGLEDEGTLWTLQGSSLVLTIDGDTWTFRYLEPRPGMIEEGVRRGTILFKGREHGEGLAGTAYRFSKRCGALPYEVSGEFEADGSLVLAGDGARGLDRSCTVTQTEHYTLEFTPQH
jgi:hypothetical protein